MRECGISGEEFKKDGNNAMKAKLYSLAVKRYTLALYCGGKPNHIYFANRALAHLKLANYSHSIRDCDYSIETEPTFVKSYFRKASA